jgi:hypothetical protein
VEMQLTHSALETAWFLLETAWFQLKSAWFKTLNLTCDILVSSLCFFKRVNLCRRYVSACDLLTYGGAVYKLNAV